MFCLVILPVRCHNNVINLTIISNYRMETTAVILRSFSHSALQGMVGRRLTLAGWPTEYSTLHVGARQVAEPPDFLGGMQEEKEGKERACFSIFVQYLPPYRIIDS